MSLLDAILNRLGAGAVPETFARTSSLSSPSSLPRAASSDESAQGDNFREKPLASTRGGNPYLVPRVAAFRRQIEDWATSGRVGVPVLVLPGAPEPRLGRCISCGQEIPEGWRCFVCLQAVYLALGIAPPEEAS